MCDQSTTWWSTARLLVLSWIIFLSIPVVFLIIYLYSFGAPASAIEPHICLVLNVLAALAAVRLLSSLVLKGKIYRAVSAIAVLLVGLCLFLSYVLALVGLKYWGRVTTVDLASTYAKQIPEFLGALGYHPLVPMVASAAVISIAWLSVYLFLSRYDWIPQLREKTSNVVFIALPCLLIAIASISVVTLSDRGWGRLGEPFSLGIFPEQGTTAMQSHPLELLHSSRIDRDEELVRSNYVASKAAKNSNVILIVVDALRADHLSLLGYKRKTTPNLEVLRYEGHMSLATSVISVCNESSCGLRGLASSRYLDRQATKPVTLEEVLKKNGYRTNLIFSGDHTNFYGLKDVYGPVDSYFDGASQTTRYINDDRLLINRVDELARWDGVPTMFHFHLMSSHVLGSRFEDTPSFGPEQSYVGLVSGSSNSNMPELAANFYDRGVLQVDRVVGDLLKKLREQGYLQNALVIVTGDHGESLGERGRYVHTHSVWEEAVRVPFLLMNFGNADPGKFETHSISSQIDVAPTILRALGMPIPSTWEGMPLQDPAVPRVVYFQQAQQIGLIDARLPNSLLKYWIDLREGKEFAFDLQSDPEEQKNIESKVNDLQRQEWRRLLANRSAALASEYRENLLSRANKPASH